MAYEFDIFLSYKRDPATLEWVDRHFLPLLSRWLPHELPPGPEPRIFLDRRDIGPGAKWPDELKSAHNRSRCLVAIFSSLYFGSEWCMSEWQSMVERQRMLAGKDASAGPKLVYAIRYSDGDFYPAEAKATQQYDLSPYAFTAPSFAQTPKFVEFEERIRVVAREVAGLILASPKWRPGFPSLEVPPQPPAGITRPPRLSVPVTAPRGRRSR